MHIDMDILISQIKSRLRPSRSPSMKLQDASHILACCKDGSVPSIPLIPVISYSFCRIPKLLYYDPWRKVAIAGVTSCDQWHSPTECFVCTTIKKNYVAAVMGNSWDHNYVLDHGQPCTHSLGFGSPTCARAKYVKMIQDQISIGIKKIPKFSDIVV